MTYKYATEYNKEIMAKAVGRSLPISKKFTVEVCNFIRGKSITNAKKILENVVAGKQAIPFRRYNSDLSHKRGIGPGRYPKNVCNEVIQLIESVEANAQFKGLNTSNLKISHICCHKASTPWHFGRQRRRKMKRTNVEIVVQEIKDEPKKEAKKGKK